MDAKITWHNRKQAVRELGYSYVWEWYNGTGDIEFAAGLALSRNASFTMGNVQHSNRQRVLKALKRDAQAYAKTHHRILMQAILADEAQP